MKDQSVHITKEYNLIIKYLHSFLNGAVKLNISIVKVYAQRRSYGLIRKLPLYLSRCFYGACMESVLLLAYTDTYEQYS